MTFFCLESLLLSKDLVPVLIVWDPMEVHSPIPQSAAQANLNLDSLSP